MELNELTVEKMQPLVGTTFRLDAPNGKTYPMQLVEVTKGVDQHVSARLKRDQFSLVFTGPPEPFFPQATYPMHHDTFEESLAIFIVPIARVQAGFRYEAVFT